MSNSAVARPSGHVPMRTCVGCRVRDERAVLVRVVLVDGHLQVDDAGSAHGRGAWLHRGDTCVAIAVKRKALGRALRSTEADAQALVAHAAFADAPEPLPTIDKTG